MSARCEFPSSILDLCLLDSCSPVSVRTKFALSSRPLNIMLEILLDVEPSVLSPSTYRKRRRSSGTHSVLSGASGGSLEHGDVAPIEPEKIGALSRKATILVVERMCAYWCPFSVSMLNLTCFLSITHGHPYLSLLMSDYLISACSRGRVPCDHGS